MNYTTKQIESAILSKLAPMSVSSSGPAETVDAYQGQFDDLHKGRDQALITLPALLVGFVDAHYKREGAPTYFRSLRFRVLCGSANLASQSDRRQNAYDLLDMSRSLLLGADLGLAITPLILEKESVYQVSTGLIVIAAEYITTCREDTTLYP